MSQTNLQRKGIWIPEIIRANDDLTAEEKFLITEIDFLDNGPKGCWASNDEFSKFLKCSESSVKRYLSHLKKLGWIKIFYKKTQTGTARHIYSQLRTVQIDQCGQVNMGLPPGQIDLQIIQENNTRNNISSSGGQGPPAAADQNNIPSLEEFEKALKIAGQESRCGLNAAQLNEFVQYWHEQAGGVPRFQDKKAGGGPHFISSLPRRLAAWARVEAKKSNRFCNFSPAEPSQDHGERDEAAI